MAPPMPHPNAVLPPRPVLASALDRLRLSANLGVESLARLIDIAEAEICRPECRANSGGKNDVS